MRVARSPIGFSIAQSAARARVAVLPCCHDLDSGDDGGLSGWVDGAAAIDIVRAMRLAEHGYRIWTQAIPEAITPKNRLLLGAPSPRTATQAPINMVKYKTI